MINVLWSDVHVIFYWVNSTEAEHTLSYIGQVWPWKYHNNFVNNPRSLSITQGRQLSKDVVKKSCCTVMFRIQSFECRNLCDPGLLWPQPHPSGFNFNLDSMILGYIFTWYHWPSDKFWFGDNNSWVQLHAVKHEIFASSLILLISLGPPFAKFKCC